ncbi:MAG: hypothetical protein ACPGJE_09505, partial [Wenzhouxiangellaceae bacterium]
LSDLSARLREHLDPAVQRLSRELREAHGAHAAQSVRALRHWLRETQQRLLLDLKPGRDGAENEDRARSEIQRSFAACVDEFVDQIRLRALVDQLSETGDLPEAELAAALAQPFDHEGEFQRIAPALGLELETLGYSSVRLKRAFEQAVRRLHDRGRLGLLPGGMLEPNVLAYLLEREMAACKRFGTVFSCVLLMISRLRPADGSSGWRGARPDEIRELLPALFRALPPHLRDIDLLGSLGIRERNIPLIVLTMANRDGADVVLRRMLKALGEAEFGLNGQAVHIELIGVAQQFDPDRSPDRKAFLGGLQTRLASELVQRLHRAD